MLRAMDRPPESLSTEDFEKEGHSQVSSLDSKVQMVNTEAIQEISQPSSKLPATPSSASCTPRRLSMRRRSTLHSEKGFGGLLAMLFNHQTKAGENISSASSPPVPTLVEDKEVFRNK